MAIGFFLVVTLAEVLLVDILGRPMPPYVEGVFEFVSWAAIPVSIFLAITRYRLYEIDRLISRTVTYAFAIGVLAGVVALLATIAGTRFDDPLVVAGTTLAAAALFNPLRKRVQSVVDRRFNRSRYDAERVLSDFGDSLRNRIDSESIIEGWQAVISTTMQPSSLGVWLRS